MRPSRRSARAGWGRIYDLQQGTLNRVTFDGDNRDPLWSADGKRIIYESSRNGRKALF